MSAVSALTPEDERALALRRREREEVAGLRRQLAETQQERDDAARATIAQVDLTRRVLAERDAALAALAECYEQGPSFGSEHCICGPYATPARDCPVHWSLSIIERHGFDYTALLLKRDAALSAAREHTRKETP